jgi:ATP phosphoribosyltransferase regulatory subunit HisZ
MPESVGGDTDVFIGERVGVEGRERRRTSSVKALFGREVVEGLEQGLGIAAHEGGIAREGRLLCDNAHYRMANYLRLHLNVCAPPHFDGESMITFLGCSFSAESQTA